MQRTHSIADNSGAATPAPFKRPPHTFASDLVAAASSEQNAFLDAFQAGKSIFLTGGAGSGKSWCIDRIREAVPAKRLLVCAPTGVAAVNVRGCTLHHAFGLTPRDPITEYPTASTAPLPALRRAIAKALREISTVVVDEISMVTPGMLVACDRILRDVRRCPKLPFGGVQVIFSGDFLQLPPIVDRERGAAMGSKDHAPKPPAAIAAAMVTYAFETPTWAELQLTTIELSRSFRQATSTELLRVLQDARMGKSDAQDFLRLARNQLPDSAVRIRSTNREVDEVNEREFLRLTTEVKVFDAHTNAMNTSVAELVPRQLRLRVGTRVMLLKNVSVSEQLANGTTGVVVGFAPAPSTGSSSSAPPLFPEVPVVDFGSPVGERLVTPVTWDEEPPGQRRRYFTQLPLRFSWAITAHKAQGLTIPHVDVDLSNVFSPGQAYVALSRARRFEDLKVVGWTPRAVRACPRALGFHLGITTSNTTGHREKPPVLGTASAPVSAP